MSYEVLARKWRPQLFDDVVGQEHVTRTLQNAITTKRIAHAYLLVGPRGVGKTSIARIFAKALNCSKGPTTEPCGKCDSCKEIAAGTGLDVLEIDGASNNGVEQVRDLRETVKYAPNHGQYKIYIIDEVHMLSPAAFNALLKTLEEPPPHVKFIFATTEAEKILPTIISRCQRFDLRRISVPMIMERLRLVAKDEKVKIDDDALLAIARGSEGGLRDAESALDQLISFKGAQISEEDVLSVFGLVARRTLEELGEKILSGDIQGVIRTVAKLDQAGKDFQRLVLELMEHFRNLLIVLNVKELSGELDLTEAQVTSLRKQAELTNTGRLIRITEILAEVEDRMRHTLSKRTLLETSLIRCSRAAVVVSLEEILAQINELRGQPGAMASMAPSPVAVPVSRPALGSEGVGSSVAIHPKSAAAPSAIEEVDEDRIRACGSSPRDATLALGKAAEARDEAGMLLERWKEVTDKVGKIAVAARSVMMDMRPAEVHADRVVLSFDPEFSEEAARLREPRAKRAVEHVISGLLNREVALELREGRTERRAEDGTAVKAVVDGAVSSIPPLIKAPAKGSAKAAKADGNMLHDPAVQKTLEMFKGKIVEVRE